MHLPNFRVNQPPPKFNQNLISSFGDETCGRTYRPPHYEFILYILGKGRMKNK
jgi:hypothetical protein